MFFLAFLALSIVSGCAGSRSHTGDASDDDSWEATGMVECGDLKALEKLSDVLPRYFEILGVDYDGPDGSYRQVTQNFCRMKTIIEVRSNIEHAAVVIENVLQKRLAYPSASPSNTLFMPVNLLMGVLRGLSAEGRGYHDECKSTDPCFFPKQLFMRFSKVFDICVETQKRSKPATDYYRFYRGLVDYLKAAYTMNEKTGRTAALYFLDTYVLPIYAADWTGLSTYRWTILKSKYPRDLVIIEEFIAAGPPSDDSQAASAADAVDIFKRFYVYAKQFWDKKILMDQLLPHQIRDVLITLKKISTDIRNLP